MTSAALADRPPEPGGWTGRFVDRGAVFAGWVGVGMALVIAIAFELIVAVQTIVFVLAPIAGLVIGAYANQRSGRSRPIRRVFANAAWAGAVTGLSLATMYVALRLLFIFVDSGYPDFNRTDVLGNPIDPTCRVGPDCTYQRYVAEGRGPELASYGVTDGASFGAFAVRQQAQGGALFVLLTVGGALVPAAIRSVRPGRQASSATA